MAARAQTAAPRDPGSMRRRKAQQQFLRTALPNSSAVRWEHYRNSLAVNIGWNLGNRKTKKEAIERHEATRRLLVADIVVKAPASVRENRKNSNPRTVMNSSSKKHVRCKQPFLRALYSNINVVFYIAMCKTYST